MFFGASFEGLVIYLPPDFIIGALLVWRRALPANAAKIRQDKFRRSNGG
jgi:hypothetical protein